MTTKEKPKWIPVTERLPEPDQKVIVFGTYHKPNDKRYCYQVWPDAQYSSDGRFYTETESNIIEFEIDFFTEVTHWMPLPEPPEPPKATKR